jgi:glycosyltransferase involved in cell wall biosynthesis
VRRLNLFYEEPDPDRFVPGDRYPRRVLRRIVRGRPRAGGQRRMFLNLCAGLDRLGVAYRVNDYRYAKRHAGEAACIVGKPHVLNLVDWQNPIFFGAGVFSHPVDDPELFSRLPVRRMLVPGEWMRRMCEPYYGDRVSAWPVGIDTARWAPDPDVERDIDVLVYDKILWKREDRGAALLQPIVRELTRRGLAIAQLTYGQYREQDFHQLLRRVKAMVFLCEHETQGIAYQQALSSGVPIFAWDREGVWEDPCYYPEKVNYGPVSSVPYWDERCGMKFKDLAGFMKDFDAFQAQLRAHAFDPRRFVLCNLTLEACAMRYLQLVEQLDLLPSTGTVSVPA